jgi:hypothetical protein
LWHMRVQSTERDWNFFSLQSFEIEQHFRDFHANTSPRFRA